ncbi:MAG: Fur family transcriptional regulator [Actinomycetota bacterium]
MTESTAEPSVYDVHHLVASQLAAHDQRYTENRRQLIDILISTDGPVTIAEILDRGEALAQSSAYRNLVVLEEAGVVHRIITSDDHARFELTEAVTGRHHHHLICEHCGNIHDVTLPPDLERRLDEALATEAGRLEFAGDHHRVDLIGRCRRCRDQAGADGRTGSS